MSEILKENTVDQSEHLKHYFSRIKNGLDGDALRDLSEEDKRMISGRAVIALTFASTLNNELFRSNSGLFYNDVDNLNEFPGPNLLEIQMIWNLWTQLPHTSSDQKKLEVVNFISATFLGINQSVSSIYVNSLNKDPHLKDLMLYRWCMLAVGHTDTYYEDMHENSPDCKKFIEIIDLSKEVVEQALAQS